jgi:hypothetical protein
MKRRTLRHACRWGGAVVAALVLAGCGQDGPSNTNSNRDPVIESVTVDPDTTQRLETVRVTVVASDADGDSLTHVYKPNAGSIAGSGAQVDWTTPDQVGDFSLLASVTDGRGGVDSWTAIGGYASLQGGSESLVGARLRLFTDPEDWPDDPFYEEIVPDDSPQSYSFVIDPLPPGTYYLDVWKDRNGNETVDNFDLFGFYGVGALPVPNLSPIVVTQDEVHYIQEIRVS